MYHIYIDAEFDAVKINNKFHQMVISLGAVMMDDEGTTLDTFYTLVKPYGFSHLTRIVKMMTHISDEMILRAGNLKIAEKNFKSWLYAYTADVKQLCIYSFGPDDRRTIIQNCNALKIDQEGLFSRIIDLQRVLSSCVVYQGKSISPTLSLDDLKLVFGLEGVVDHNALSDAQDLMNIHLAYLHDVKPKEDEVEMIVKRKAEKQREVQEKQKNRLNKVMRERFAKYKNACIDIVFCPEVVEQLLLWEESSKDETWHWKQDELIYEGTSYKYKYLHMRMCLAIDQAEAGVLWLFQANGKTIEKQCLLQYRNAPFVEAILQKLCS